MSAGRRRRPAERALGAAFFMAGGGGAAAWGICDAVAWTGALHRARSVVETENFIPGLPLLGAGLCAIGPELIASPVVAAWSDQIKTRMAVTVLGSILAGILVVFLGQFAIIATMELSGYRACDVGGRGRADSSDR